MCISIHIIYIYLPSGVSSFESSDKYTSLPSINSHSFYPIDISQLASMK